MKEFGSFQCPPSLDPRLRVVSDNYPVYVPARTHLPYELLHGLLDRIVAELKFGGDTLCLLCESHAAPVFCIEGTDKFDLLLRFRTDWRLLEDDRVSKGDAWGLVSGTLNEAQEGVWEVGCEETGTQR